MYTGKAFLTIAECWKRTSIPPSATYLRQVLVTRKGYSILGGWGCLHDAKVLHGLGIFRLEAIARAQLTELDQQRGLQGEDDISKRMQPWLWQHWRKLYACVVLNNLSDGLRREPTLISSLVLSCFLVEEKQGSIKWTFRATACMKA